MRAGLAIIEGTTKACRRGDVLAHWSTGSFVVQLTNITPKAQAAD